MESELPNFSLNLDFGNFENETPKKNELKTCQKTEDLDKSVEDQKSINTSRSTQFALRNWHFATVTLNFGLNLGTVNA